MKPVLLIVARLPALLVEQLHAAFDCHHLDALSPAQFAALAPTVRAVAANGESIFTESDFVPLSALEIVAVFGVGYDGVDARAAHARGVNVTHTPDVLTDDVADFAFAQMLAAGRHLLQADAFVRRGDWPRGPHPFTTRVSGATLGIIGLGRIGQAIARRAEGFGMTIAYTGRGIKHDVPYPFHDNVTALAQAADFLVVCAPGGAGTKHLIDQAVLSALGPNGYLINVGRGSLVDPVALAQALSSGTIAGAALDVFEDEPNVDEVLLKAPNLLLTPHMASATALTRRAMGDLVLANLVAHFDGRPLPTPVPEMRATTVSPTADKS
jgi:lactate dehydrogenase-like 2-hydroxyacid dehydrogenase